jgi:putative transposase
LPTLSNFSWLGAAQCREEQIIRILHDVEAQGNVRDVCRQHNIAEQTLYRWRRQFGGREVSDAKRLRALQRENAELKRLVGELTLDNRMLNADFRGAKSAHILHRNPQCFSRILLLFVRGFSFLMRWIITL